MRDTGIGIPADALPAIFDMFAQVDRSLEKSQGGLGIGLTLVKQLRGNARRQGRGAQRGPRQGQPSSSPAFRWPPSRRCGSPRTIAGTDAVGAPTCRILVADDNRDAAESMSMVLRLMGNEVRTVNDGLKAVEEAAAFRPDLVLLDIGMPRLNGYEAARRIRARTMGQGHAGRGHDRMGAGRGQAPRDGSGIRPALHEAGESRGSRAPDPGCARAGFKGKSYPADRRASFPERVRRLSRELVAKGGIEPPTQGFSVLCSTN